MSFPALHETDARIVRAWSYLTAHDLLATPAEIAAYLAEPVADVTRRMERLRACNQIPRDTIRAVQGDAS